MRFVIFINLDLQPFHHKAPGIKKPTLRVGFNWCHWKYKSDRTSRNPLFARIPPKPPGANGRYLKTMNVAKVVSSHEAILGTVDTVVKSFFHLNNEFCIW